MSRGLGVLERLILAEVERQRAAGLPVQARALTLASDRYEPPASRTQRGAMVRAMHSLVRKFPQQYARAGGKGRKGLLLYQPDDRLSAEWARSTVG